MSRTRRDARDADLAAHPWGVLLTDRSKAGAPIRLADPFGSPTDAVTRAATFASKAEADAWIEKLRGRHALSRFVLTADRLR